MSWLTDPKGCGNCNHCGMDMEMAPYCTEPSTKEKFPIGMSINLARAPKAKCGPDGKLFTPRMARKRPTDAEVKRYLST